MLVAEDTVVTVAFSSVLMGRGCSKIKIKNRVKDWSDVSRAAKGPSVDICLSRNGG